MKNKITPYKNIYSVLKINRFIVLAVVVACLLTSVFSILTVYRFNHRMLNSTFAVNTDGSIIPLKLVSQKENMEVEALSHLDLFHNYFYGIDESNYRKNLEKSLWLGDSTGIMFIVRKRRMGFITDYFNTPWCRRCFQ